MAEGSDGNNWWDGWLQTAKEKSTMLYENVKKDLGEFTQAVHTETSAMVNSTAATLRDRLNISPEESTTGRVKQSFSNFFVHVSEAFTPVREEDDDEVCVIRNQEPVMLDRFQAKLYTLHTSKETFLVEPNNTEDYERWLSGFDLESHQAEFSELMMTYSELRRMNTKLVPNQVSHVVFWHRYFFRVHQAMEAEKKRQEREEEARKANPDELKWDEGDEFPGPDIPEHIQKKLLDDYEKECEEMRRSQILSGGDTAAKKGGKRSTASDDGGNDNLLKVSNAFQSEESVASDFSVIDKSANTRGSSQDLVMSSSLAHTSPSSSNSRASNEESWEKDFELDLQDLNTSTEERNNKGTAKSEDEEEWEKWS